MSAAPAKEPSRTRQMAFIGLAVNIGLALTKLIAGIVGHSGALIADAIESLADIAGSAVIWSGLTVGAIPADEDHPYGHGKAEALAGMVVAVMVFAAGISICVKAVHDIRTPHTTPALFTLVVLVGVVVVKTMLFVVARRVAKKESSGAVEVDAWHHISDAITSLAAFFGISIALFGSRVFSQFTFRWETADDWAALLAGGIILVNAVLLARVPLRELMDAAHPEDLDLVVGPARRTAMSVSGVRNIEKVFARKSGSGYWLDMHVQVDGSIPVREAHAIGGRVRAAIRGAHSNVRDVLIHIEPFDGESVASVVSVVPTAEPTGSHPNTHS